MNKNKFIQINKNTWYIRLDWEDITVYENFKQIIIQNVNLDKNYTILLKIRYDSNKYIMLGNQISYIYASDTDLSELYNVIIARMSMRFDEYNINNYNFEYITLKFIEVNNMLLSDITYDRVRVNQNKINISNNTLKIPLTTNDSLLGDKLYVNTLDNTNKLILPNPHSNINVDEKMYNNISKGITNVYFRHTNPPHMLYITELSNNSSEKSLNTLTGKEIVKVKDVSSSNTEIIRHENKQNKKIFLNNNEIIYTSKDIKFNPIPLKKFEVSYHQSINIGVIDFETYFNIESNISKVYAAGFRTFLTNECYIEYIDKDLNSDKIILNLINELLRPKYENIKFYCHNLGGYDAIFILKALYEYNETNKDKYLVDVLFNDNKALKIVIKKKNKNKFLKITIVDSYSILNNSLKTLAEKFEVDTKKGYFPYKFVNTKTLWYKGDTPELHFYEDMEIETYNSIISESWDLKSETIKYLEQDLNCLYEIIIKFSRNIYNLFDVEVTNSLTISSLSMQIYQKKYYKKTNLIPSIQNNKVYEDIKQAYYGGKTEVYRPLGYNLFYYDVNSLYPFVAKNYMVGLNAVYTEYTKYEDNIYNLFGYYYAEVDNIESNLYIALLPYRHKDGLYFPKGKWKGWYFSEELKFAKDNGYKINILRGYTFEKQLGLFDNYVNDIYKIKSKAINKTESTLAKSLLNNLLGRFGLDINKPTTKIVTSEDYEKILLTSPLKSETQISENTFLVTYIPTLGNDLKRKIKIDPQKAFDKLSHLKTSESEGSRTNMVSVAISAAVTAYGRIHMSKIILHILSKGGKIYYTDTDSIVTDIKLDDSMISSNELGKLKNEHNIVEGYFISNKTYAFINTEGKTIKKSKGLDSRNLTFQDFVDMYNEKYIKDKFRKESIKDYSKGSVKIEEHPIELSPFSYKKREKIYLNGKWVDTKTIQI